MRTWHLLFVLLLALTGASASAMDLRLMASTAAARKEAQQASGAAIWRGAVLSYHRERAQVPAALKTADFEAVLTETCALMCAEWHVDPPRSLVARAASAAKTKDALALFADFALAHMSQGWVDTQPKARALLAALDAADAARPDPSGRTALLRLPALQVLLIRDVPPQSPKDKAHDLAAAASAAVVLPIVLRSRIAADHPHAVLIFLPNMYMFPEVGATIQAAFDGLVGDPQVAPALLDACRAHSHHILGLAARNPTDRALQFEKAAAFVESAWKLDPMLFGLSTIGVETASASQRGTTSLDEWLLRGLRVCPNDSYLFSEYLERVPSLGGDPYARWISVATDVLDAAEAEPSLNEPWVAEMVGAPCRHLIFSSRDLPPDAKTALSLPRLHEGYAALAKRILAAHPSAESALTFQRAAMLWHAGQRAEGEALFQTIPAQAAKQLPTRLWRIDPKLIGKGRGKPAKPSTAASPAPPSTGGPAF